MRTTRLAVLTSCLAALEALWVLMAPPVHAQGSQAADVVIDLLAVPPDTPTSRPVPPGDSFRLLLANRAPGAEYRVTIEEVGRAVQTRTLGLPFDSMLRPVAIPACAELSRREQDLMHTADEASVPSKVKAIRDEAQASSCSLPKAMADMYADESRPLIRAYLLDPDQQLKVTIERLAPETKAVQRRWQVSLLASAPKPVAAYATEEEWLVSQISRDVAEMVLYARSRSLPDPTALSFSLRRSADANGVAPFAVSLRPDSGPPVTQPVTLAEHVWSPQTYEPLARALLERTKVSASSGRPGPGPSPLSALADLRAGVIEAANQRVSAWLARDMASAEAHEQAALVLAAMALRESAGRFHDRRPALSRMTAHLAMARALRAGRPVSPSGEYAEIALLTVVGRNRDALDRLDAAAKRAPVPEAQPWATALRTFNTGDWRIQKDAARASLLERWAQFQTLSSDLGGLRALEFLRTGTPENVPDWGRFALQSKDSVEEGNLFAPGAVALELKELSEVWKLARTTAREPAPPAPALNEAPGRCLGRDAAGRVTPRVIDWGTWARFSQRHLLHALDSVDNHLRTVLGLKDDANAAKREARQNFGNLLLFPFLDVRWQADADDRQAAPPSGMAPALKPGLVDACPAAVRVLRETPEAGTAPSWELVERRCSRERQTGQLPSYTAWFSPPVPSGTAFEAYTRLSIGPLTMKYDTPKLEALLRYSPWNKGLVSLYAGRKFGGKPDPNEAARLLGPLLDFDLWSMKWRASLLEDDVAAYRRAYEPICRLDADSCLTLARYLADHDLDEAAVEPFERAVKEARDRVGVANQIGWLMDYYFDHRRSDDALKLAQMGAEVYSGAGLRAMARLMERMGRYREAESYYQKIVERYGNQEDLDRFYVRYEQRVGDGRFRGEAQEALKRLFPQGLRRATLADFSAPPMPGKGYVVTWKPSPQMARVGMKTSDVIVAIDGYRVDDRRAYETVWGFTDKRDVALIVWREGRYVELKGQVRREPHGPAASTGAVALLESAGMRLD